ncbi:MAG: VanW family protein, partial [Clostridiales bacterium]|nr:VanW family protein [Clostridiales bacterium]
PLYTGKAGKAVTLKVEKDLESAGSGRTKEGEYIEIFEVDPSWVKVRTASGEEGYLLRKWIHTVEPIDEVATPPYGVVKHQYIVQVAKETQVYMEPTVASDSYVTLQPGTKLGIIDITDGWGRVIRWRNYAYIDMRDVTNMIPVSHTDRPISGETPIAAYTSYYSVSTKESNLGRMWNIAHACEKISIVLQPGDIMDMNKVMGPYNARNGYKEAPVLFEGTTVLGGGGGTCQVSSTFYNVALQLPGIEILKRRPHGPGGASYLPHGVDAAVGNESINLIVQNNYDFPIRVEASSQDGALFIVLWKVELNS